MQYLVLLRSVDTDVLGSAKIANLRIKGCQFWHLDEGAEPLFLNDVVCDGELVVSLFLGKDGCPSIETVDALLLQSLRTEVFEKQIQFCQTVGNGRSRKESGS